jgi:hypothetical protein
MAAVQRWHEQGEACGDLDSLLRQLLELQLAASADGPGGNPVAKYAFRGLPNADWQLKPTIVHKCKAQHDDAGLHKERELVEEFRKRAWRFVRSIERRYLSVKDIDDPEPAKESLQWDQPNIWSAIAIARHYGVPTRLLDWTQSAWVAAYFAACGEATCDGAVWWFDQLTFERVLHRQWDSFEVPIRDNRERVMEQKAFDTSATRWMSKIHHDVPFHRLEVQQGFFTACGRLDMLHDEALENLSCASEIPHGRLIVPAKLKKPLLDTLEYMGVHAHAIDYPGADLAGHKLTDHECP